MRWMSPILTAGALGLASCTTFSDAWMTGWTDAAADDRIMLVRAEPPSLGYQRLKRQSGLYPDLAEFLAQRKWPDFLAETSSEGQHYLVLYYLERKEAWAGRTKRSSRRIMEFSGPQAVTDNELRMLSSLKAGKGAPGFQPERP